MDSNRCSEPRKQFRALVFIGASLLFSGNLYSQANLPRELNVYAYQTGKDVKIGMAGMPKFPTLTGEMTVERSERKGTDVLVKVKNLPPVLDLGGLYTTYVLWTVGPNGTATKEKVLPSGERGPSVTFNTSLTSFAVVISAEPYSKVNRPSPRIVLESKTITDKDDARYVTASRVLLETSSSEYFDDERIVDSGEKTYRKRNPLVMLRAVRAVEHALYAGADQYADKLYKQAQAKLQLLQNSVPAKVKERELEQRVEEIEGLASRAVEEGENIRNQRKRDQDASRIRNELKDKDESLGYYKNLAEQKIAELAATDGRREAAEINLQNEKKDLSTLRSNFEKIQAELDKTRTDLAQSEKDRQQLAKKLDRYFELPTFKAFLEKFGKVRDERGGFVVELPETIWLRQSGELNNSQQGKFKELFEQIAIKAEFNVIVSITVEAAAEQLFIADHRANALLDEVKKYGIRDNRVKMEKSTKIADAKPGRKPSAKELKGITEIKLSLGSE